MALGEYVSVSSHPGAEGGVSAFCKVEFAVSFAREYPLIILQSNFFSLESDEGGQWLKLLLRLWTRNCSF